MTRPYFSDSQFLDALSFNSAMSTLDNAARRFDSMNWNPGLINPDSMTFSATGLTVGTTMPLGTGILFGDGTIAEAHGIVSGQDTQTYATSFALMVPGSGTVTAYLLASYAEIDQDPYTVIGPPVGHPDYNPNFVPYVAYGTKQPTLQLTATLATPDNLTTFELARTALTAGATGVVLTFGNQVRVAPPQTRKPVSLGTTGSLASSGLAPSFYTTAAPITTSLPAAALAAGRTAQFINLSTSGLWTLQSAGVETIPGVFCNTADIGVITVPPGQSVTLFSTGTTWVIVATSMGPRTTVYAGNPNSHVAGRAANGVVPPDTCWDSTNKLMWVCVTSGNAAGAVWQGMAGGATQMATFGSAGNWIVPAGIVRAKARMIAGGGGGGCATQPIPGFGSGGGAGGYAEKYLTNLTPGTVFPVVIGAGGLGANIAQALGQDGGATQFAGVNCPGGLGGQSNSSLPGGGSGYPTGADYAMTGAGGYGAHTRDVAGNGVGAPGGVGSFGGGANFASAADGNGAIGPGCGGGGGGWNSIAGARAGGGGAPGILLLDF